jgi:hypothetical protein
MYPTFDFSHTAGTPGSGHKNIPAKKLIWGIKSHYFILFFCESSLFRINQRYHGLGTRLWHTPPAAAKKTGGGKRPRARSGGERGQGQSLWIDLCVPPAPLWTPRLGAPSLLLPPSPLSPPDPTPSIRPTGRWCGTRGLLGASSAGPLLGRPARLCAGGGLVVSRRQPSG